MHEPPDSSVDGGYITVRELKITVIMTSLVSVEEIKFGGMVARTVLGDVQ